MYAESYALHNQYALTFLGFVPKCSAAHPVCTQASDLELDHPLYPYAVGDLRSDGTDDRGKQITSTEVCFELYSSYPPFLLTFVAYLADLDTPTHQLAWLTVTYRRSQSH